MVWFDLKLVEVPGLAERMAAIMCVDNDLDSHFSNEKQSVLEVIESEIGAAKEKGESPVSVRWLELDELDIDDDTLLSLDLATKFPVSLFTFHSATADFAILGSQVVFFFLPQSYSCLINFTTSGSTCS